MSKDDQLRKDSLAYHASHPQGKMRTVPTKPHATQRDLSLAYSPGVAYPCLEIEKWPENAYKYTAKGNLVAVISNGTAVLGLGDIGALASKPVMEGKGLLFKAFADIDVFDIELDAKDVDSFVETVKRIAPTFGGINLEDIAAPECFEIERRLVEELDIPVMHDDQHGTAIISGAALLNGLEVVEKNIEDVKVVVSGAGASALSCSEHWLLLGVRPENMLLVDSKGIITESRRDDEGINEYKARFARDVDDGNLADAMKGADVFLGLSVGDIVSGDMLLSMAPRPLVFALANPDPEIMPDVAKAARPDAIVASGRSDFANQVNNVLGFPYIFRGALDCMAKGITAPRRSRPSPRSRFPTPSHRHMDSTASSSVRSTSSPSRSTGGCSCGWHQRWRRLPWRREWRASRAASRISRRADAPVPWRRPGPGRRAPPDWRAKRHPARPSST